MLNNWVYILLLLIISFILFLRTKAQQKQKKACSILVCCILILFSGFRYQVGTDYLGYSKTFDLIVQVGRFYNIEWGYYGLVKLCSYLGGNAQLVFFIFSAVTISFIYKYIEEFSENVELSWMLFVCIGPYFLSSFNGVRQWLSISVFAYSLQFIRDKKIIKYFLFVCCAGLFHYSCFLLLPFYFILSRKSIGIGKVALVYASFAILNFSGLLERIANVLHATSYLSGSDKFVLGNTYYVFFIMAVLCWLYFRLQPPETHDETYLFENMNLMSGLFVFLAITATTLSNMIFTRFNQFFFIGYIILVPLITKRLKRTKTIAEIAICALAIIYFAVLTTTANDLTPYTMNFKLFS